MAKWIGTVACALLVLAFFVSCCRAVFWISKSGGYTFELAIGAAIVTARDGSAPSAYPAGMRGWHVATISDRPPLAAYPWLPTGRVSDSVTRLILPLWLPFILIGIPTSIARRRWWVERHRIPLGHCESCNYDLTSATPAAFAPSAARPSPTT